MSLTWWLSGTVGQIIGFQWLSKVGREAYGTSGGGGVGAIDDGVCPESVIAAAVHFFVPYLARPAKAGDPGVHFQLIF
jgi:hypothetical protein